MSSLTDAPHSAQEISISQGSVANASGPFPIPLEASTGKTGRFALSFYHGQTSQSGT